MSDKSGVFRKQKDNAKKKTRWFDFQQVSVFKTIVKKLRSYKIKNRKEKTYLKPYRNRRKHQHFRALDGTKKRGKGYTKSFSKKSKKT